MATEPERLFGRADSGEHMAREISVVVPTMDRADDLRECLASLAAQERRPDEVVVVADGPLEAVRTVTAEADLATTLVAGPGRGLPAARNAGVAETGGDIVCFVDDDVVLPVNWLRELLAGYEEGDPAGVGGLVVNYSPAGIGKADATSRGYRALTALRHLLFADRVGEVGPMGVLYAPHTFNTTGTKPVDALQGCNMSFRSSVFEEHEFDEWYGEGGAAPAEELDFCARVRAAGGDLVFAPRAVAVHKRTLSGGERGGPDARGVRNLAYYLRRNARTPRPHLALLCVYAAVLAASTRSSAPLRALGDGLDA